MSLEQLRIKQNYPIGMKVALTKQAIREFVSEYGIEGVYVPYSGGKDSTVLLHIIQGLYGNQVPAVFSNTKNEFDSIIKQVNYMKSKYGNLEVVMSEKNIENVIEKHGYPVVSKKTSRMLRDIKNPTEKNKATVNLYKTGIKSDGTKSRFKLANKHQYLIESPFKISEKCCDELKKKPFKAYEKRTGRKPIIATMAHESQFRKDSYIRHGCNNFKKGSSTPLGFWLEQDILTYIVINKLKIASVYGEILQDGANYRLTGEQRTGCVACLLGMEFERNQDKNRIQRLKEIEPKKYDYVLNKLGFKQVLEYMDYNY